MKHTLKKSIERDNLKVNLKLSAEFSMTQSETDIFLEMIASCKGTDQGFIVRPDPRGYPYQGVSISESHELTFQQYVLKGFDPVVEEEFTKKIKLILLSFKRYNDFLNSFNTSEAAAT